MLLLEVQFYFNDLEGCENIDKMFSRVLGFHQETYNSGKDLTSVGATIALFSSTHSKDFDFFPLYGRQILARKQTLKNQREAGASWLGVSMQQTGH